MAPFALLRGCRRRRASEPGNERLQHGIHRSINGSAAGLRNTG